MHYASERRGYEICGAPLESARLFGEERVDLERGHGFAEEVSLVRVAGEPPEVLELRECLYPLRDDGEPE